MITWTLPPPRFNRSKLRPKHHGHSKPTLGARPTSAPATRATRRGNLRLPNRLSQRRRGQKSSRQTHQRSRLSRFVSTPEGRKKKGTEMHTGILSCLDGYMNIAMEQTEEHVGGRITNRYGDAFIRGNNGARVVLFLFPLDTSDDFRSQFCTFQLQRRCNGPVSTSNGSKARN